MAEQPNTAPLRPDQANLPKVAKLGAEDRHALAEDCKAFLRVQIPSSNIVSQNQFSKFLPLFNKDAVEKMSEMDQKRLFGMYNSTFSLQHPIKIYGGIVSEPEDHQGEVVYVQTDRAYHEVLYTIPAMFRQLRTLNELGSNVAASLINSFLNTAAKSQDNPMAQVEFEKYGYVIGHLIKAMNPPDAKAEADYAKAEKALTNQSEGGDGDGSKNSQEDSDAMVDLFDF